MKKKIFVIIIVLILSGYYQAFAGPTFNFSAITSNSAASVQIAEDQMTLTVNDLGSSQIQFLFSNAGPEQSTIAKIYFNDNTHLSFINFVYTDKPGQNSQYNMAFTNDSSPGTLQTNPWVVLQSFSANSPAPKKGVNIEESLGITFNLTNGATYSNIISALGTTGGINIGIHVTNILTDSSTSNTYSESLLLVPNPAVPAPGAVILASLGAGFIATLKKRNILK